MVQTLVITSHEGLAMAITIVMKIVGGFSDLKILTTIIRLEAGLQKIHRTYKLFISYLQIGNK